ncbi:MAG: 16S rRNA processing protein RimM [Desulfovibrio sp.]|nr:16S rRNA processing protein RimM [Desulfovibrio sp.]
MAKNYIHMGSFGRPHGIAGEIVLDWYAVSPFSLAYPFFLQTKEEDPFPLTIESFRRHNGRLLIRVAKITSRDQAEKLRGKKLVTKRSSLPEPKKDEAYIDDLLGAYVFLDDGTEIGLFSHTIQGTSPQVWVIRTAAQKEILFPAHPSFIRSLDASLKRIVIDPPKGLLELYLTEDETTDK